MNNHLELQDLKEEVTSIAQNAKEEFGGLTAEQLNWKPSTDRWSVAQCFDHLITTNAAYFPIVESVVKGEKQTRFVERLPFFPKIWAKLLIKSLDPKTTRKLKAPAPFEPSSSDIPATIIDDFVSNQKRVEQIMNGTGGLNLSNIIITSPAAGAVIYSLLDAFRIIVVHEQRHFLQAKRVKEENGFPR